MGLNLRSPHEGWRGQIGSPRGGGAVEIRLYFRIPTPKYCIPRVRKIERASSSEICRKIVGTTKGVHGRLRSLRFALDHQPPYQVSTDAVRWAPYERR